MRLSAPSFWWQRRSAAGYLLAPFGAAYGLAAARRMRDDGADAGIPVICVGNFVVGGAGKTPTALTVAETCRTLGLEPGFLTRGYRGRERGPTVVATRMHGVADVGDEALLLARTAPTVVAADRPSGARLLRSLGADVVVMDDGFQNPSLRKDLALIVLDGARDAGNGFVLPAGPLRAPLAVQMRRADALIVLGEGGGGQSVRLAARAGLPVLRAAVEPGRRRGLKRAPYLAFAGIAHPAKFFDALAAAGAEVAQRKPFPDHHVFTHEECTAILAEAEARGLVPITTEKDIVRLAHGGDAAERLAGRAEVFPVRAVFREPARLAALIRDAVAGYGDAYRRAAPISAAALRAPA
jgi:tetraacyldisaccharide 4'-kinase